MSTRAFVGIELADANRTLLASAARALGDSDPAWAGEKWVAPQNLHVTLRFLGPVSEEVLGGLPDALGSAVTTSLPFEMRLAAIASAGTGGQTRMLWTTFSAGVEECRMLAATVLQATEALVPVEGKSRRFSPHITIVRARRPRPVATEVLAAASAVIAGQSGVAPHPPHAGTMVSVRAVTLFSSTLGSEGPTYEVLARANLGVD